MDAGTLVGHIVLDDQLTAGVNAAAGAVEAFDAKVNDSGKSQESWQQSLNDSVASMTGLHEVSGLLSGSFGSLVTGIIAGDLSVRALIGTIEELGRQLMSTVTDFETVQDAQHNMVIALEAVGDVTPGVQQQYEAMAQQIQSSTMFSTEQVENLQASLTTIGNVGPQDMNKMVKAGMDLAVGMSALTGGTANLSSASMLLAKAAEGNVTMLQRYGIYVDQAKVATEGFAAAVSDAIENKFGGDAGKSLDTLSGKLAQNANEWVDAKAKVGDFVGEIELGVEGTMLHAFQDASSAASMAKDVWDSIPAPVRAIGDAAAAAAIGVWVLNTALVGTFTSSIIGMIGGVASAIRDIGGAFLVGDVSGGITMLRVALPGLGEGLGGLAAGAATAAGGLAVLAAGGVVASSALEDATTSAAGMNNAEKVAYQQSMVQLGGVYSADFWVTLADKINSAKDRLGEWLDNVALVHSGEFDIPMPPAPPASATPMPLPNLGLADMADDEKAATEAQKAATEATKAQDAAIKSLSQTIFGTIPNLTNLNTVLVDRLQAGIPLTTEDIKKFDDEATKLIVNGQSLSGALQLVYESSASLAPVVSAGADGWKVLDDTVKNFSAVTLKGLPDDLHNAADGLTGLVVPISSDWKILDDLTKGAQSFTLSLGPMADATEKAGYQTQASLQASADKAEAVYAYMKANEQSYTQAEITDAKARADAERNTANGVTVTWQQAFSTLSTDLSQLSQIAGSSFGALASAAGTVVGAVHTVSDSMKLVNTGEAEFSKDALSGIASVSAGVLGIVSAVASAVSAIASLFTSTAGQDQISAVGNSWGVTFSDSFINTLNTSGIENKTAAALINLKGAIADVGGLTASTISGWEDRFAEAFDWYSRGLITASQETKILDDNWSDFAKSGTDAVGLLDAKLVAVEKDAAGLSATLQAYQQQQVGTAVGTAQTPSGVGIGLSIYSAASDAQAADLAKLTDLQSQYASASSDAQAGIQAQIDATNADLKTQQSILSLTVVHSQAAADAVGATIYAGVAAEMASGKTFAQALTDQASNVTTLGNELKAAGLTGSASFQMLQGEVALVTDKVAGPALQSIEGMTQAVVGLSNSGMLTQDTFSGLESQIGDTAAGLINMGYNSGQVMGAMQSDLQVAWEESKNFGYTLDPITQDLVNQAQAAGLVGPQYESSTDKMVDALQGIEKGIAELVQDGMPNLAGAATTASEQAGKAWNDNVVDTINNTPTSFDFDVNAHVNYDDSGNAPGGSPPYTPPAMSTGGIVYAASGIDWEPQGSDTVPAMLTPGERVLSVSQNHAYEGLLAAGPIGQVPLVVPMTLMAGREVLTRQVVKTLVQLGGMH